MDMKKFERLRTAANDFLTCWEAMQTARSAANETTAAVSERLKADRQQNEQRIAELEEMAKSPSRTETAREMTALELEKRRSETFSATPEEIAAFNSKADAAENALADFRKAEQEVRNAYENAKKEMEAAKAETYASQSHDANLAAIWIKGDREEFGRLAR